MSTSIMLVAQVPPTTGVAQALHRIVQALPTDPASLFVIALLVGSAVLVLWAGRPKGGRPA
ncbi:MAG: hypothetical protein OEO79_02715 [Gemmatimonadota bacterium]|nr:hypothetical protein [Gemmatimonadota bacterium]